MHIDPQTGALHLPELHPQPVSPKVMGDALIAQFGDHLSQWQNHLSLTLPYSAGKLIFSWVFKGGVAQALNININYPFVYGSKMPGYAELRQMYNAMLTDLGIEAKAYAWGKVLPQYDPREGSYWVEIHFQ